MIAVGKAATDAPRQLLWVSLAFIAALLLLAVVVAWVDRWRKRRPQERLNAQDQLAHFRSLYERGELSSEEYARIHQLLSGRIRKEIAEPPAAPPVAPPPASPAVPPSPKEGNGEVGIKGNQPGPGPNP